MIHSIPLLQKDDATVRTQITLTKNIKRLIEQSAEKNKESLSEYLRRAALLRWLVEKDEKDDLSALADRVIGSVNLKKHPEWKTKEKTQAWVRKIRKEW